MSITLSNTWNWTLRHSPLIAMWRSFRGVVKPNKEAFSLLEAAELPRLIDEVIRVTIVRTRLWRDERTQVAQELIAHAQDAIDAGRSPKDIVEQFGDPCRVARLLRRSMKRKRPFSWQLYRISRRALGTVVTILFAGYLVLAIRFYAGTPSIDTDYFALLDTRGSSIAPEQRSWPVIADVGHRWDRAFHQLSSQYTAFSAFPNIIPSDDGYQDVADTIRAMEQDLLRVREASTRAVIGAPIGYELEEVHEDGIQWTVGIIPADHESYKQHTLIEALLPQLSWTRRLSDLLAFDARLAIREGDSDRAVADLISMANLARQCAEEPYTISALVAVSIDALFTKEIEQTLQDDPGVFNEHQLVELAHANAMLGEISLNLHTERLLFEDILQRAYTNDGDGNGRMTAEGARLLAGLKSLYWREANLSSRGYEMLESVALPSMLLLMNDRQQERSIYNAIIDRNEQVMTQGPQAIGWLEYDERMMAWRASQRLPLVSPAELISPAMGELMQRRFHHEMLDQATSTMLAIEVYRIRFGVLPETLSQIPPSMLPQQPMDAFDPGGTLRYLRGELGGYAIYSVGADGDDDLALSMSSDLNKVRDLRLRYPFRITHESDGRPRLHMDAGNPEVGPAKGPDGDWILIDTRPETGNPAQS